MKKYIGVDLGTSSVKAILISEKGIEKSASREYAVSYPQPNYSEQDPADWDKGAQEAIKEILREENPENIKALSFSGQMHGLVMLDKEDRVIRPAILWNDGRSVKETDYLNHEIGRDFLLDNTGNIAFAGFTAPKILWVKNNEPENFDRTDKIMLPKDYLAYLFSGNFCTDVSDASGTLYFDVKNRCWSKAMLDLIGIRQEQLPRVLESYESAGKIKSEVAEKLGLSKETKIIIGAGDNAASAIGTGTVNDGDCNISLGTSGTIFVETKNFAFDRKNAIHSFCSANGEYHYLACILSAAACQKWWVENIIRSDYSTDGIEKYIGKNQVYFLPYLMGERSPINNPNAKAMFYGMTPSTTREEMTLAVLEGVAFALRQNIEIIRSSGVNIEKAKICGGGAKNRIWLKVIADILNLEILIPQLEQGGALGAALLAARGLMDYKDYCAFAKEFYGIKDSITPDKDMVEAYDLKFREYLKLYREDL